MSDPDRRPEPAPAREPTGELGGGRSTDHARFHDPEIAVRADFERARATGTAEGWRLFADRHPAHPLAAEARRHAEALDTAD